MSLISSRRTFLQHTLAAMALPVIGRAGAPAGFTIGLAADAQYADIEPKGTRYYRLGLPRLAEAAEHFNARGVAFCVHLGDLIDREWRSFDEMLKPLASSRAPWHHLLGNHDFDVLDQHKPKVPQRLGLPQRYRTFDHGGYQFVILDTNDVSTYAHAAGTPESAAAQQELARHQAAKLRQAKTWNGAVGAAQLAWLDRTCKEARAAGRRVIVLAHHPVYPDEQHNAWNATDILAVIDRHPHVVAWINGHNHAGGYGVRNGVHYLTMRGMVETANTSAFATAQVLPDRMILTGHGREPVREMVWKTKG